MKQIPNVLIVYRRPLERQANPEKIVLDSRNLQAVPLLEGEEAIKVLVLSNNSIRKIDHLVSLPNLQVLDFSSNKLAEINCFWSPSNNLAGLRQLILGNNQIRNIKNLENITNLEILDL
jgi:Leucine-rich repeat (LRR) protein